MSRIGNVYQDFIHVSRYARWVEEVGRRESWEETVDRYINFMKNRFGDTYSKEEYSDVRNAIVNLEALPSMRALMTAGEALSRENVAGYNCSYVAVDSPRAFDETLYILMNGTGVGFSVEDEFVSKLPRISDDMFSTETVIVVHDSKLGWAKAYKELIALLYMGQIPTWDVSRVRPRGARLKVFGGRASGPEPLVDLFKFTVEKFVNARGRKLKPIEAHDIMCKIGEVVVVGGVRRSALISFSDLGDFEMAKAKSGQWWEDNPQRALANNTAVYKGKPAIGQFLREWRNLYESKSGERGIQNIDADRQHFENMGRREYDSGIRGNPCNEVRLNSQQFCNLSEIVVRHDDDWDDLRRKVEIATILGTWQSSLTDFKYLRKGWKNITEEERLLGVSMTGIFGNKLTSTVSDETAKMLVELKDYAIEVNAKHAERIGINPSVAITVVKPAGTTSQLTLTSSGIHPWHSQYYIRRVRGDIKDPLTEMIRDAGVPCEPDVMKPNDTVVFSFPIAAPEGAVTRHDLSAIDHLKIWQMYRNNWTEHNPSVTISVREDEWVAVAAWVYENFDDIGGISFLPYSDHTYQQAPYEDITKEQYEELLAKMPEDVNWDMLSLYENEDGTSGSQELACSSGSCEVVNIGSVQDNIGSL